MLADPGKWRDPAREDRFPAACVSTCAGSVRVSGFDPDRTSLRIWMSGAEQRLQELQQRLQRSGNVPDPANDAVASGLTGVLAKDDAFP